MNRNRMVYALAVLAVIGLGLASRHLPGLLSPGVAKYAGDALWALMVYVGFGLLCPRASIMRVTVLAGATSHLVEFSQIYHAPWIDTIRHTTLGNLALGFTFSWFDLLDYTAGVLVGAGLEGLARRGMS